MNFEKIGLQVPDILLPNADVDLNKWAVVACDQYTSQPEYWSSVEQLVGDSPSTLNIIFPEVYLEDADAEERIKRINQTMQDYLEQNVLQEMADSDRTTGKGFVLVDRKTSQAPSRKGLVVALDLEQYDFNKDSQTLIRATEGTIVDRLPPRIKVRQDAAIELPHIMVLIDDPDKTVIEPLFDEQLVKLYDFDLMMESGHIKGYAVDRADLIEQVANALGTLASPELFAQKYQAADKDVLLYAMGDGNHSLATAKAIWEKIKTDADDIDSVMDNPARYALVELVNIHDDGLQFEPIHRVVFDIQPDQLLKAMQNTFSGQCTVNRYADAGAMNDALNAAKNDQAHRIRFIDQSGYGLIEIETPSFTLELATLESFLTGYLEKTGGKVDFIHGDDVVEELGVKPGNMGFFLPPISKQGLFRTIIFDGALPRKTFSMGEADEKRFYLEARKIR